MNIIWNKEELKEIKRIIQRSNMKLNGDAVVKRTPYVMEYSRNNIITNVDKYFLELFYCQDRNYLNSIMSKIDGIKEYKKDNKGNENIIGLVENLSELDSTKTTDIFKVLKELEGSFSRIVNAKARVIANGYENQDDFRLLIEKVKNDDTNLLQELTCELKNRLALTNGIYDKAPFCILVAEKFNNLKQALIKALNFQLSIMIKREQDNKRIIIENYVSEAVGKNTPKRYHLNKHTSKE